LDVLLLKDGRDLTDDDYVPSRPKPPEQLGMDIDLRAKAIARRTAPSRRHVRS
jgi:hypothetical protein